MNTNKETKMRFKRKVFNAVTSVDALVTFSQVHNEDDESVAYRRGCELEDELNAIAESLNAIFNKFK